MVVVSGKVGLVHISELNEGSGWSFCSAYALFLHAPEIAPAFGTLRHLRLTAKVPS